MPIWVPSRRAPGIEVSHWPLVTYLTDLGTAMTEAKRAAGDKNVLVHRAATAQLALAAGSRAFADSRDVRLALVECTTCARR